jgi:hypothetical protein
MLFGVRSLADWKPKANLTWGLLLLVWGTVSAVAMRMQYKMWIPPAEGLKKPAVGLEKNEVEKTRVEGKGAERDELEKNQAESNSN